MAKSSSKTDVSPRKVRPAISPEARENQMIAAAVDLAEQQLRDGTASSQVITHFLKLGTTREKLEKEMKKEELKLIKAKTEALQSQKRLEETYEAALAAMKSYAGQVDEIDEDE